jgi:peptidyl-prolyl cis-trans isomerase D
MFEMLRKMILPIIITVLVLFVGMIVLEWGLSGRGGGLDNPGNLAGVVNGENISYEDYNRVLNNLYEQERQSRGVDYEIPEERERQLEQQAWNELVADRIIKQEGAKMKITVSDADVYNYLKSNPPTFLRQYAELQTNGQFDYQKYLALMTDDQATSFWAGLEPAVREDLKRIKVQQHIVEAVHVSDQEARQAFLDSYEKIGVGIVNVPTSKYYPLVTDPVGQELQTYFTENREKYKLGERVVLEIVRVSKEPSPADQESARVRAREIYDSCITGSDFAEFARVYSDDASASNGGDVGWFPRGRQARELDSAAFAMREGEISTPVKTSAGWYIIKHLGYRTENGQNEAHVAQILVKAEASAQTLDAAWQRLEMVRTGAEEMSFADAAKGEELEIYTTTPPVEKEGRVGYVNAGPADIAWAFKAEVGDLSDVLDLTGYYCLMRLSEKLPSGQAELKDVENKVKRDYRNAKLTQMCHDTALAVYAEVERGMSLIDAASKHGLAYDRPAPFTRTATILQVNSDPAAIGAAFALQRVGQVSKPVDHPTGSVLFELLERQVPDLALFDEKRDSVFEAVVQNKQRETYNAWYTQVNETAKVESFLNFQRRR